mmetsp:Transcript_95075/g.130824  ORF Transcript_95075/g.130824 Transcript_95075/m.130824 type:complete len:484 (+) Transcript_95075:355-1806(+)
MDYSLQNYCLLFLPPSSILEPGRVCCLGPAVHKRILQACLQGLAHRASVAEYLHGAIGRCLKEALGCDVLRRQCHHRPLSAFLNPHRAHSLRILHLAFRSGARGARHDVLRRQRDDRPLGAFLDPYRAIAKATTSWHGCPSGQLRGHALVLWRRWRRLSSRLRLRVAHICGDVGLLTRQALRSHLLRRIAQLCGQLLRHIAQLLQWVQTVEVTHGTLVRRDAQLLQSAALGHRHRCAADVDAIEALDEVLPAHPEDAIILLFKVQRATQLRVLIPRCITIREAATPFRGLATWLRGAPRVAQLHHAPVLPIGVQLHALQQAVRVTLHKTISAHTLPAGVARATAHAPLLEGARTHEEVVLVPLLERLPHLLAAQLGLGNFTAKRSPRMGLRIELHRRLRPITVEAIRVLEGPLIHAAGEHQPPCVPDATLSSGVVAAQLCHRLLQEHRPKLVVRRLRERRLPLDRRDLVVDDDLLPGLSVKEL